MFPNIFIKIIVFLYGIIIGSFLNVCIYRIPKKESIVKKSSHCTNCGSVLNWYDLFPVLSYLFLGGRCRKCKERISLQYPVIELLNGVLYLMIFNTYGLHIESLLYAMLCSSLIVISVIDYRTFEIPLGINIFILTLGLIRIAFDDTHMIDYAIGFFSVSGFLLIIYVATKGKGIGGGDIKLMATCGLLLGWKLILLGFLFGCIGGAMIHLLRMKYSEAGNMLAFGPYLSMGILFAVIYGNSFISWYLKWIGV